MVIEVRKQVCDGHMLKWLFTAGLAWLEYNQERVNQMNVFPVPDGDTGTNMVLTLQKAHEIVGPMEEGHVGIVGEHIARGALRGARGNSGVILSQLLRGFSTALRGHEVFDVDLLDYACRQAVDAAYKAVIDPVEGTVLTVARQASEALSLYARDNDDLVGALDTLVSSARRSLEHTPEMLPVLKKAGVMDSGGQGLVFMLEGMSRMVHGKTVHMGERRQPENHNGTVDWHDALAPEDELGYGYDVQFLMRGENLDVENVRQAIDAIGWSTLVVGDDQLIKVHVHVHDPGEPLTYAHRTGAALDDVVVENMQAQYETYVADRIESSHETHAEVASIAVVTVASGTGMHTLFTEGLQAAKVITGGQTMNPSTDDFLRAIETLDTDRIILLPNNGNVVMAARQASSMAKGKKVAVIASTTLPQGISAMLAYLDTRDADDFAATVEAMRNAMTHVVTCEITTATRDAHIDDLEVRQGQAIGLINNVMVAAGDTVESVMLATLGRANAASRELITVYYSDDVDLVKLQAVVEMLTDAFPDQQIDSVYGGQPLYPYIISVE